MMIPIKISDGEMFTNTEVPAPFYYNGLKGNYRVKFYKGTHSTSDALVAFAWVKKYSKSTGNMNTIDVMWEDTKMSHKKLEEYLIQNKQENLKERKMATIKIKEATAEELSSLFPPINSVEFSLISGVKLIVSANELKKIQEEGHYDYLGIHIPLSLIDTSEEDSNYKSEKYYGEITKHMGEKFIHVTDVVDSLYPAVRLGENCLLYGKGGHGKSEMTEHFFAKAHEIGLVNELPFVTAFGEGMTEEALFGGMDMKKFKDTGEYHYLVENSFMNHEVVVFEEIFDAVPQILLSLKDILTSGYFRKGKQLFKIKTKVIIGLTNRSKEDIAEDASLEALMQRFAVTTKVEWDSYKKTDFMALFNKVFEKDFTKKHQSKLKALAEIIENNNQTGSSFVSPRTAVKTAKLYAFGSSLNLVSDLDKEVVKGWYKANTDMKIIEEGETMINRASEYFENIKTKVEAFMTNEADDQILSMLLGKDGAPQAVGKLTPEQLKEGQEAMRRIKIVSDHLKTNNVHNSLTKAKSDLSDSCIALGKKLLKLLKENQA